MSNLTAFSTIEDVEWAWRQRDIQACIDVGGHVDDRFFAQRTQLFLTLNGMIVFVMQAGFAYLEAGAMGSTAVTSVLFKNLVDAVIGGACFFATGYAFFSGKESNAFIGYSGFFLNDVGKCQYAYAFYILSFSQCTCTIVSGAIAGRTKLIAYVVNTILLTSFVWPVVAHWVWSDNAWLTRGHNGVGFIDFAGSGVVHVVGGTAALTMSKLVGPRGTPVFEKFMGRRAIPAHSMPLVSHGTLILWFGFLAFNTGSVTSFESIKQVTMATQAAINTALAPCGGGIAALAVDYFWLARKSKYWSLTCLCNGCIAGMVSICAGANQLEPWAAFVVGLIGGVLYRLYSSLVNWVLIDDPVDAIAVHMGAGSWGLIAVALFSPDNGVFYHIDSEHAWRQLGWNFLGIVIIIGFTLVFAGGAHLVLYKFDLLRVDDAHINMGLDLVEHGEGAYHILSGNAALPMNGRANGREEINIRQRVMRDNNRLLEEADQPLHRQNETTI